MFETMRKVFGPIAVGVIIGSIALVFVFYGVFVPGRQGANRGGYAILVNGTPISFQDYSREYQQRVQFYQNLMKGKVDQELLERMGLKEQVMEKLIQQTLILQEAERLGFSVSDQQVADQIADLPYFKKDGKFDPETYKKLLSANRMTAAGFEKLIRDDLLRNNFVEFVRNQLKVRDEEVKSEFLVSEDQRQVEYVLLSRDNIIKKLKIPAKEVQTKMTEILKANRELAEDLLKHAKNESVTSFKANLKKQGLDSKTSEKFNRTQGFVSGIGESSELVNDVFAGKNILPKLYEVNSNFVIVFGTKSFKPEEKNFEAKKQSYADTVMYRKQQQMMDQWVGDLRSSAKLSFNSALVAKGNKEGANPEM